MEFEIFDAVTGESLKIFNAETVSEANGVFASYVLAEGQHKSHYPQKGGMGIVITRMTDGREFGLRLSNGESMYSVPLYNF